MPSDASRKRLRTPRLIYVGMSCEFCDGLFLEDIKSSTDRYTMDC